MIENAYIHFFERKRITGSDIISWSPPPQRFGYKLQRVKKRCRHSFVFFKTNVWFYVTWSLVALSLVVTRSFQLELERFCTLAWLFWGYCICSNQFLHHSACLQFSSLALVLSYGITGALKVFFSSREQTTPILMLLHEHWGFLSFYISLSLPQKRRSFSKHGEGCRPASLLGESSEKDPWDFENFLLYKWTVKRWLWLLPIPFAVEQYFQSSKPFQHLHFKWTGFNAASSPLQLWVLRLLHRQLFWFLLPLTPLILLSLGVVLTCSSRSENWIKAQWCSGERRAGWEGVGVCYSSVSHLVVTIYCIFYLFFLLQFC